MKKAVYWLDGKMGEVGVRQIEEFDKNVLEMTVSDNVISLEREIKV